MNVLDFLHNSFAEPKNLGVESEFRLLCSGELYNSQIETSDWRKSDLTRILLDSGCQLLIASRPFDDYPQELALRFAVENTTDTERGFSHTYRPDDEIADDLASLLTVICRRLITVCAKVREVHRGEQQGATYPERDLPISFVTSMAAKAWKRQPITLAFGRAGITDFTDYNPQPKGIDPAQLHDALVGLPTMQAGEQFVRSARLYSAALELIQARAAIAYQLFVSSVEALSNAVMTTYQPSTEELIVTQGGLLKKAREFGLDEAQATELALEACRSSGWISRKFVRFIVDHSDDTLWEEDDLFRLPNQFKPAKADLEETLKLIYRTRSSAVHAGETYPSRITAGLGPGIPVDAVRDFFKGGRKVPPVTWFERVVNKALNLYLREQITQQREP